MYQGARPQETTAALILIAKPSLEAVRANFMTLNSHFYDPPRFKAKVKSCPTVCSTALNRSIYQMMDPCGSFPEKC